MRLTGHHSTWVKVSMTPPGDIWTASEVATLAAGYEARIAELLAVITAQQSPIASLLARVAERERQLGLNTCCPSNG